MKRILLGLFGALLALLLIAFFFRTTIALRMMERVVATNLASDWVSELPDGLHLVLCGAGSPLPDPKRSGPCVAVIAGQQVFVVDAGSGASRRLSELRFPQGRIDAILLTHFHSDHIDGLGELLMQRWVNRQAREPVPIHGPTGVEEVVDGVNREYRLDSAYRVAHHGEEIVPPSGAGGVAHPFPAPAEGRGEVVIDEGGAKVTAFRVDHTPVDPAVGYRFDYGERSLVLSGDTIKSENLQRFAEGVDLLLHDALAPHLVAVLTRGAEAAGRDNIAKITRDILTYHASPVDAAEVARDAGVGFLLYYHVVPPLPLAPLEDAFLAGVDAVYDGPLAVGRDGTTVHLPVRSDAIDVEQRL
jgi:ribonuclease Z